MRIKKGTQVLVKAVIVRDCGDDRPLQEKGYVISTSRGTVMVEPEDLLVEVKK